ncbi:hypothetical protein [Niallia sp. 03133]
MNNKREKSQIETNDSWNRALYGSPTIGGFVVIGALILYVLFH